MSNFKRKALAAAICLFTFSVGAAEPTTSTPVVPGTQGQGVINFKGTIIDAPCGIAPDSVEQSVDFGQISKAHLEANGTSKKYPLKIKLVNCDATALSKTGSVKVAFSGTAVKGQIKELGTASDTGTSIIISEAGGNLVSFDGTPSIITKLNKGDNTLIYSTWVKKATGGNLKEGEFSAVANFNLTYE
ncbi:TPA: type 1 fimbrial protein [Escherichia coli]|nr:type 1 fimbrial protein [Escherichia coli]